MTTAIWWVRRDLRLHDNQALAAAMHAAASVVPVFVLDPALLASGWTAEARVAFLLDGLRVLDAELRARGSGLVVRAGEPAAALRALVDETGARAVFAEADHSPYARARDARVAAAVPLETVAGVTVRAPGTVVKPGGEPYVVFTPFMKAWQARPLPGPADLVPAPAWIATPPGMPTLPIPDRPARLPGVPFDPGEAAARRRLAAFTAGGGAPILAYGDRRDRPDLDGTSGLSPYLRFGMLSARAAVAAAVAARAAAADEAGRRSAHGWLTELAWREFYIHILHHFPGVRRESFRADLRTVAWRDDPDDLAAWQAGRTGYPFVDAAMRQLAATGWMHNRARMVVAAFLVKDLLVDWRAGERHFMRHLVDGDPAANNGGWQWAAGTGTDAAPYFRVFNPVTQGVTHDPRGEFVRRWVPELAGVPDAFVHAPWTLPAAAQRAAGCVVGRDYPAPIVDHGLARARALAVYAAARDAHRQPKAVQ